MEYDLNSDRCNIDGFALRTNIEVIERPIPIAQTKHFQSWFGESKIVDENGGPLVVYHGTRPENDPIDTFSIPNFDGAYFTPDPLYAEAFTCELFADTGNHGPIYPVFLSIKNPYIVHAEDGSDEFENFVYRGLNKAELIQKGYDGAKLYVNGYGLDQIIAFFPNQIKSAIGNNGEFDCLSNRIDR